MTMQRKGMGDRGETKRSKKKNTMKMNTSQWSI